MPISLFYLFINASDLTTKKKPKIQQPLSPRTTTIYYQGKFSTMDGHPPKSAVLVGTMLSRNDSARSSR
jgi:hypothetical protein